jgi:tetratricopeptide (TPR) repeat protein
MKSTASLVDHLEELTDDVLRLGDRLAQTVEDVRLAKSLHAEGVAAELSETRKALLDCTARLKELEEFLCPAADIATEPRERAGLNAPSRNNGSEEAVSLRPADSDAGASPQASDGRLGRKWEEAEARLTGLTDLVERALRAESASDAAMNLGNLALQYHRQRRFEEAERLYQHALVFREKFFGPDHATVATGLNNLAILYRDQKRYQEATALFRRSLEITERTWGPDHPKVARRLCNLASLALEQEMFTEAKSLFDRILAISEAHRRVELPEVTASLTKYAKVLERTGQLEESASLTSRIQILQTIHPNSAGGTLGAEAL